MSETELQETGKLNLQTSRPLWSVCCVKGAYLVARGCGVISVLSDGTRKVRTCANKTIRRLFALDNFVFVSSFDGVLRVFWWDEERRELWLLCQTDSFGSELKGLAVKRVLKEYSIALSCRGRDVWLYRLTVEDLAALRAQIAAQPQEALRYPQRPLESEHLRLECVSLLEGTTQDVKSVAFHPSKDLIVCCSYDSKLRLYTVQSGSWVQMQEFKIKDSTLWEVFFHDNRLFVAADSAKLYCLVPRVSGQVCSPFFVQLPGRVDKYQLLPETLDLSFLLSGFHESLKLHVYHAALVPGAGGGTYCVLAVNTGQLVLLRYNRSAAFFWRVAAVVADAHSGGDVRCAVPTADGQIVSCGNDEYLRWWRLP